MKRGAKDEMAAYAAHRPGKIPPDAMEMIADVFLASSGRDKDRPAYDEEQLNRKRRRVSRAEAHFSMFAASRYAFPPSDTGDILDRAGLTPDERMTWEMYSQGYRVSEIAGLLHVTRPTAARFLKSAARRIAACESAFRGLGDVYHHEVHRQLYRKPMHCSEQPCRRLGYCKYALQRENE